MKTLIRVNCGDWHKGWGYGGHDKIGKLEIIKETDCPINFYWKGYSQGRHGQTWNRGARLRLMVTDKGLRITEQKGSYPDYDQIIESANILLKEHKLPELPLDTKIYHE